MPQLLGLLRRLGWTTSEAALEKSVARQQERRAWREGRDISETLAHFDAWEGSLVRLRAERAVLCEEAREKAASFEGQADRADIAERFSTWASAHEAEVAALERALSLAWRARAIQRLHAVLAVVLRAQPPLQRLPDPLSPLAVTDEGVAAYADALHALRAYSADVVDKDQHLEEAVPRVPEGVCIPEEHQARVSAELAQVRAELKELSARVLRLVDEVDLALHALRSRRATAGTRRILGDQPGGNRVIDEVGELLGQLQSMEQLGEVRMAGLSADALDESVREVERAGLAVVAETEAAVEVGRLVKTMVRRNS